MARPLIVIAALALIALGGIGGFVVQDAAHASRMPVCADAPADWECWGSNGDTGHGELPPLSDTYWDERAIPTRYASAEAARQALASPPWRSARTYPFRRPHRPPPHVISGVRRSRTVRPPVRRIVRPLWERLMTPPQAGG